MRLKYILSVLIIYLCLPLDADQQGSFDSRLITADSLYFNHRYEQALLLYEKLSEVKTDVDILFKIAVCNYYQDRYYYSMKLFNTLKADAFPLTEYLDYFLFLIALKIESREKIIVLADHFREVHSDHYLCDSLQLQLADFLYLNSSYEEAYHYYHILLQRNIKGSAHIHVVKQVALIKFYTNHQKEGMERMYQVLKKYPSSEDALSIAKYMNYLQPDDDKFFFAMIEVFLQHKYFTVAKLKLEQYIGLGKNEEMIEKARYYLIRIYYLDGEYAAALYGFMNILEDLKNKTLAAKLQLEIARCHLNLSHREKAIKTYLDYADKYTRRRIASEALWKAAWIYEELGDLINALDLYKILGEKWPRSFFVNESRFREGFTYYRLGDFNQALTIFQAISRSGWSDLHKDRAVYWIAKSYRRLGREAEARALEIDLGARLFSTYYSAKCYWLHRADIDSALHITQRITVQSDTLVANHLNYTEYIKALRVRRLLGNTYGLKELAMLSIRPESLSMWLELADIYKKMEAYHEVFRIYDFINYHYFSEFEILDKPFLLNKLYPLWYSREIGKYCAQRSIEEFIILAIVRQESIFNREAKSSADAYGLMQIIPSTATSLASDLSLPFSDPQILFQAEYNINLGTLYVQQLLKLYNGQMELMLAAYNAGPHRVERWNALSYSKEIDQFVENIEYNQTRNYVRYVMRNYWVYQILDDYR
jgi:soluble lytic murein transglycosylase-like protein/TolA-binding protein